MTTEIARDTAIGKAELQHVVSGEGVQLNEGVWVKKAFDALMRGEFAARVLPLNGCRAAAGA